MRTCEIAGCGRKHRVHGLCQMHYARKRRGKPMDGESRLDLAKRHCSIAGCSRARKGGGLGMCKMHYDRKHRGSKNAGVAFVLTRKNVKRVGRIYVSRKCWLEILALASGTGRTMENMAADLLEAWYRQKKYYAHGSGDTARAPEMAAWAQAPQTWRDELGA